jgi:hypothetical protein
MATSTRPSRTNVYLTVGIACVFSAPYALAQQDAPSLVYWFARLGPPIAVGVWFQRFLRNAKMPLDYSPSPPAAPQ